MKNLGQLMMFGVEGTKVTPELEKFIKETNCGGVILFAKNIENPEQVKNFISDLQSAAETPLIMAVDQEGGRVARLKEPFTKIPPMGKLGELEKGEKYAAQIAEILAKELSAIGFNLDFAPVLDVATNPLNPVIGDRSFSDDAQIVADLGAAFIKSMQSNHVAACGKHFPGHGDTDLDSHLELPHLRHDRQRFERCEWIPFRKAIAAGVSSIMTAHLMIPSLDKENVATISERILTGILRKDLGFDGLIFTDDLTMKGIENTHPTEESSWQSIRAGADIAMVCHRDEAKLAALDGLKNALDKGLLSKERVEESLKRVAAFKAKYCSNITSHSMDVVGCATHHDIIANILKEFTY